KIRSSGLRDQLNLTSHWAVQIDDLSGILMRYRPHIVHISAHGSSRGEIKLEGADGNAREIPIDGLAAFFRALKDEIRVVLLNACHAERQARALVTDIDCAIGMSNTIDDADAIAFSSEFYQALGYGKSVKQAFDLGVARLVSEGIANADRLAVLHQ